MVLNDKTIPLLVSIFIVCLFFQPCFSAEDFLNITIHDVERSLEVLQGECKTSPFHIINKHNGSVHIRYGMEVPSGMSVTSFPKEYTMINSNQTATGNLKICAGEQMESNTYNVSFWIDTLQNVGESRVKSKEHTIEVSVLNNPDITITTSTKPETTTTPGHVTSTTPVIPVNTTTMKETDTEEETSGLFGKKNVMTIGVIVIALALIAIPFLSFKTRQSAKIEGS